MSESAPAGQPGITNSAQNLPLVIGVDLGGTQIRTGVLRGSQLISRVALLTGDEIAPDRLIPRTFGAIQQALDEAHTTLDSIAGIGIAVPGPLDHRTGEVFSPPNMPGWDHVPLRAIFEQWATAQIPIYVENDANAAGLGEFLFSAGRGCRSMVYLTISTGIGGGIIVDGEIMEGASGTAGELGHMTIDWHGERCKCGNIGCLEYLASGTAIARQANEAIMAGQGAELLEFARALQEHSREEVQVEQSPMQGDPVPSGRPQGSTSAPTDATQKPHMSARIVSEAAQAGIPLARAIITNAAEAIGAGLVNIIHIFNPEMIILGGGVTQMGPMLMEPALRIVQERAMKIPRDAVRIVLAELGANSGLVGAGALVYHYGHIG